MTTLFGKAETKKPRGSLKKIFGRVAAVAALAATVAFYGLGFQIGQAYYQQWQQNKAEVTQTWDAAAAHRDYTENLPWLEAGAAITVAYGAGAAAIAAAKSRRRDYEGYYSTHGYRGGGYYGGGSYSNGNDGFWLGYVLGNSNGGGSRSSYSSSGKNNGGAAAAIVIVGAVALAAGASVVSYKALKENFKPDPDVWAQKDAEIAVEKAAKEAAAAAVKAAAEEKLPPQVAANTPEEEPETAAPQVKKRKAFTL